MREVYDFLYVDVNRIARLVAQLDGSGLLQEITRELSAGGKASAEFKIPTLKVSLSPEGGASQSARYDPTWRLPVVFLDEMKGRIVSDVSAWEVGQIVQLKGVIAFQDYAFTGQALSTAVLKQGVRISSPSENELDFTEIEDAAMKFPHLLISLISDGKTTVWSTLNDACTTASTGDLILKCGNKIEGEWTITGILDTKSSSDLGGMEKGGEGLLRDFSSFNEIAKKCIGRPTEFEGVTPLTVHRRVTLPFSTSIDGAET